MNPTTFTVTISWERGEEPEIISIREAGCSDNDRRGIAYALRYCADLLDDMTLEVTHNS